MTIHHYLITATSCFLMIMACGPRQCAVSSISEQDGSYDLAELRKSPEYVDLTKYEIEETEEKYVPQISPQKSDSEEDLAITHIKYDRPVNGYTVTVDLFNDNFAMMHFEKGNSSFSVEIDDFEEMQLYDQDAGDYDGRQIVLPYIPVSMGKTISTEGTFFFTDIDFDGQNELVYVAHFHGSHGCTAFRAFELDGTPLEETPFGWNIDEQTEFNRTEKSITLHDYGGVDGGSDIIKYKRQADGTFQVTDSTRIIPKMDGNYIIDSLRLYYRKQGDKMVLVKKEIVK